MAGMVKMRFLADTPVLGLFTRDNIRPDSAKENRYSQIARITSQRSWRCTTVIC